MQEVMSMSNNKQAGKTDYGNWVPKTMIHALSEILAALLVFWCLDIAIWKNIPVAVILGILFLVIFVFAVYMGICRRRFSFEGGALMGEIHEFLVNHLSWDGTGELLDIGCGAGALSIRCAKRFSKAKITGMDYWGKEWDYAKEQCEKNAEAEKVAERTTFEKGDAAHLPYETGRFDAAVSNFVFHEVRTQPDKRLVVMEALRVVKKGGAFAFQDMFEHKALYGDMEDFVEILKKEGIQKIYYIPDVDKLGFIPGYIRTPWMLRGMGLLYGIK